MWNAWLKDDCTMHCRYLHYKASGTIPRCRSLMHLDRSIIALHSFSHLKTSEPQNRYGNLFRRADASIITIRKHVFVRPNPPSLANTLMNSALIQ